MRPTVARLVAAERAVDKPLIIGTARLRILEYLAHSSDGVAGSELGYNASGADQAFAPLLARGLIRFDLWRKTTDSQKSLRNWFWITETGRQVLAYIRIAGGLQGTRGWMHDTIRIPLDRLRDA